MGGQVARKSGPYRDRKSYATAVPSAFHTGVVPTDFLTMLELLAELASYGAAAAGGRLICFFTVR